MNSAARRRAIRRLIVQGPVKNQAELVAELRAQGFTVTQATVSRDLTALGVTKNGTGYTFRGKGIADREYLARTIANYVESFASSGNLVVLRTPPGAAQVVAAALDASDLEGVLGTVAGDDTVLVVADVADGGLSLRQKLEAIGVAT